MEPFITVNGIAAPLLASNIDTDVIMPKQFLKGIDRVGLDKGVFFDLRFLPNGQKNPEFTLNKEPWSQSKFLVVGPNFGCGSSREHAVWGLKQLGIKALIGTTFAGIFYDNCQRNGVLLVQLSENDHRAVANTASDPMAAEIVIDLESQKIWLDDARSISFKIDTLRKRALLLGLDAIGSTLQMTNKIKSFERSHYKENPWLN